MEVGYWKTVGQKDKDAFEVWQAESSTPAARNESSQTVFGIRCSCDSKQGAGRENDRKDRAGDSDQRHRGRGSPNTVMIDVCTLLSESTTCTAGHFS